MTDYGVTGFSLDGLDLRRHGYNIATVEGWESWPGLKLTAVDYAYSHGDFLDARGYFRSRDISVLLTITPYAAAGGQTLTPVRHVDDNLDAILGALYASYGADLVLARTMGDASVREIDVRPISVMPVRKGPGTFGRQIAMLLHASYPFWQETGPVTLANQTVGFTATNDGNAPLSKLTATFNVAGRLTHDVTGDYIETNTTNGIVCDCYLKTAKIGATFYDNRFSRNRGWWLQMEPGGNDFTPTLSADVDLTFRHSWL